MSIIPPLVLGLVHLHSAWVGALNNQSRYTNLNNKWKQNHLLLSFVGWCLSKRVVYLRVLISWDGGRWWVELFLSLFAGGPSI